MRIPALALLVTLSGCSAAFGGGAGTPHRAEVHGTPGELVPRLTAIYGRLGLAPGERSTDGLRIWSTALVPLWELVLPGDTAAFVRCTIPGRPDAVVAISGRDRRQPRAIPGARETATRMVSLTVSTTLEPEGTTTRLETRVAATLSAPGSGEAPARSHCVSTGRLEQRIHSELRHSHRAVE